jgi:hypothetical protein
MGASSVIVARVRAQYPAQMRFAEDDDVVQAFPANGPNQSFSKTVLPRRPRRDRFVADAHGAHPLENNRTEDAIAVANQVPWC